MLPRSRLTSRHLYPAIAKASLGSKAVMSTFVIPDTSPDVTVCLTEDVKEEQLLSFPAFKSWLSTLQHSLSLQSNKDHTFNACPYKLRKIDIQAVDFFGGGRLGFVKLKAEISNDDGEKLPGSVFVGILTLMFPVHTPNSTSNSRSRCSAAL